MAESLEYSLQQLGLEKNEAAVYLAALQLGPSPVQRISARAGVPRATTYLVLDALKREGLVTTYEQGKKTYYASQHPAQLEALLQHQENRVKVQKEMLGSLVPKLERIGQFLGTNRPRVRYYEGKDAFPAYRRDLLSKRKGQKIVRSVLDLTGLRKVVKDIDSLSQKRAKEHVRSRVLYVDPRGEYPVYDDPKVLREGEKIDSRAYPIPADVSIIGDSVGLMPYGDPFRAAIIDDPAIAQSLNSLFELAWRGAAHGKGKSARRSSRRRN